MFNCAISTGRNLLPLTVAVDQLVMR